MNKIALALILVLGLIVPNLAMADGNDLTHNQIDTSGADYANPMFNTFLNHDHSVYLPDQRRDYIAGLGIDVVLYESANPDAIFEEAVLETKYDFSNDETSLYAVGRVNAYKPIKSFITNLFR